MLKRQQMQEIQDLKLRGYTQTEILQYFIDQGLTPPTRQTIAKYYKMDVVPDNPGEKLAKEKVFDIEPFRSTIIVNGYVSSEYALTKRTGKLFKKVLELESVKSKEVLHLGDNLRSDWFRLKLIGVKAILVKSSDVRKK